MEILDAKCEANGEIIKMELPPEIAQFRLNFLNRVINISENLKLYYVNLVEDFIKIVNVAKSEEIDIGLIWNELIKNTPMPDATIDWEQLIPTSNILGLRTPRAQGIGEVISKDDPRHPLNRKG